MSGSTCQSCDFARDDVRTYRIVRHCDFAAVGDLVDLCVPCAEAGPEYIDLVS